MNEWVQIAGWVLIHFLWQGSALAIIAAAALRFCRRRSSSVRYSVACLALGAMLAAPLLTAFMLASQLSPAAFVAGSARLDAAPPVAAGRGTLEAFRAAQEVLAKTARVSTIEAYLPLIVSVWLAGVAVLLLRTLSAWYHVRRLHKAALGWAPSSWQLPANRLAQRLRLRKSVRVV